MTAPPPSAVRPARPLLFLCYSTSDKPTATRLAHDLVANGVEVFWDEWEIRTGDSIRQKIDLGLGGCTHFAVLLTPDSISRPWVNAEIDAGLIRKLDKECAFLPLRLGLDVRQLPPFLRGLRSVALDEYDTGLRTLLNDIHGISNKPPHGPPFVPHTDVDAATSLGLSIAAYRIVRMFCLLSEDGTYRDPLLGNDEMMSEAKLTVDELEETVDELESLGLVKPMREAFGHPLGYRAVGALTKLFAFADGEFMPWDPKSDARILASMMLDHKNGFLDVEAAAKELEWTPRRINPACEFLVQAGAAEHSNALTHPIHYSWLQKTPRTRRFLA